MSRTIVLANQKGGVSKTSTVRNLSYSLAELGKKVLAVDLDPQCNLTVCFGLAPKKMKHTSGTLITRMLTEEELPEPSEFIQTVGKVDLIPASRALTVAEVNMLIAPGSNKYLSKLLSPLKEQYDFILIDTSPSLGALTINALTAADEVIIPVDPELFAMTGLNDLMDSIGKVKEHLNPNINIAGVLFVKCIMRTNLYKEAQQNIGNYFNSVPVFENVVPMTVKVGEANNRFMAVAEYDSTNPAAVAYTELAKEVFPLRRDEKLKTIFETAAQIIVRGESSWKDYLAFASKIHKYSFDNALLVYAQASEVTALATLAQWNKVGRSVIKGAESIAVCDYDNARLTLSYLFDISQTTGKAVKMTDWRLDTEMRKELAERFIRAYSLTSNSFAEVITALSAEKAAENYENCLRAIKGNSENHIFEELPDGGLEEQLVSMLTDSTAYLVGKRCGLSDDEILLNDGMKTIGHFNRIPLIAPLGNAVMGNAKEILIEMELTIKTVNMERKAINEQKQTESQLHGERRNQVSESANIQRQHGGRTAGQVRSDGSGISERKSPRSVYSFENGWQSDGNDAPDTVGGNGENRTDDTAASQNRPNSSDRGHDGTDTTPEQPEAVSRGNDTERNGAGSEVNSEQPNTSEKEPSTDGSFSLPVNKYLEQMMLSNLFYPPNFFNRLRYIDNSADTDNGKTERIKAAFLADGDHADVIDGTPVSVTATDENLIFSVGDNGEHDFSFKWKTMQELIHGFIENGSFPAMMPAMSDDEVRRNYEYILTSTDLYPSELHTTLRSVLSDEPENADWTEKAEQTKAAFGEYGTSGKTVEKYGIRRYSFDSNGISYQLEDSDEKNNISWPKAAAIVRHLVNDGRYLDREPETTSSESAEEADDEVSDEPDDEHDLEL